VAQAAIPTASQILAPKVRDLFFDARGQWVTSRYKTMHGGRGSLKSWGFARMAILLAAKRKVRIACAREYQNSIAESVHETLRSQIELLGLDRYFDVKESKIKSWCKSEFFFAGLKTNPRKFKSTEGIDVLWIEEGEGVSAHSWQTIVPTLRKKGSEIWCGFNPDQPTDPTSQLFIENPHPLARVVQTNWRDNPWFSDELRAEKDYLASVDDDAYQHVWEGGYRKNSAAQVLAGKCVSQAFEPSKDWGGPYQGLDFGFAVDPTAGVKMWIDGRRLYIEHEAYKVGCDIDATPALLDQIPDFRKVRTRADCARPETISYLQRHGYSAVVGCEKWDGSVEDGVAFLRSFEQIVIHPRCKHALEESRLWSYKVDKLTKEVLPELVDKHNHIWDAARYGLQPLIKRAGTGLLEFYRQEAEAKKAAEQASHKG
jgi:phage terminase large subunit